MTVEVVFLEEWAYSTCSAWSSELVLRLWGCSCSAGSFKSNSKCSSELVRSIVP